MRPKRGFGRGGGRAPSERARLNMAPTGAPKMAAPEAQGVSGEDGGVPAKVPRRGGQGPSGPRAAVRGAAAAGRMRGTAFSNRKAPKAEEKAPSGRPGTEEKKEAAEAGRPAKGQGSPPGGGAAASGGPFEKQPLEVRHEAKPSPCSQAWSQGGAKEQQASLPLQTKLDKAFPKALPAGGGGGGGRGGGAAGKAPPKGSASSKPAPEATFTPTAAGLRPQEDQDPEMTEQLKTLISQAIAQGIATGLQQQGGPATSLPSAAPVPEAPPVKKRDSLPRDGGPKDKGVAPNPFATLFCPSVFKTLLQKAKITANLGGDSAASGSALGLADTSEGSAIESDEIPSTKLFLDVVQREWVTPGVGPIATCHDKKFYNVDLELSKALEPPAVDAPVAALMTSTVLPTDPADELKGEDKRAEITHRKLHQAAAWAIKAANAASFFNRTTLLWLHQMQARVPPDDVRTHQDLNKLIVAAEFSADATLNTIKFASRAIASSVIARRLLWLRPWVAATRNKWKLAAAPFKGSKLFGDALDPVLIEAKDGRKFLPSMHKRPKHYPPPLFPKHSSFQPTDVEFETPQPQKVYFSRWDRQEERQPDRQPERQLERHPDPDRHPDRKLDRLLDLDIQTDRHPDRQLDRLLDLDIQTDRYSDRPLDRHPDRYPDRHPDLDRQPDRHPDRQLDRLLDLDIQTDRHPDRQLDRLLDLDIQMDRHPDRQLDRLLDLDIQMDRHPDRQLDRHPDRYPDRHPDLDRQPDRHPDLDRQPDRHPDRYPDRHPDLDRQPDRHPDRYLDRLLDLDIQTDRHPDRQLDRHPDRYLDRHPDLDRQPDRHPDRQPDRHPDRQPDRYPDRYLDRHPDRYPDRHPDPDRHGFRTREYYQGGRDPRGMEPRVMDGRGMEPRGMEPRGMEPRGMDGRGMEPRGMEPRGMEPRGMEPRGMEPRGMEPRGMEPRGMEPRGMEPRGMDGRGMEPPRGMDGRGMEPPRGMDTRGMEPPRGMESRGPGMEPRGPGPNPRGPMTGPGPLNMGATGPQGPRQVPNMQGGAMGGGAVQSAAQPGGFSPGQNQVTPQDHEKAALIMQVLQLTADQIAMLPPEQRQSILILKEQIQKSTGAP